MEETWLFCWLPAATHRFQKEVALLLVLPHLPRVGEKEIDLYASYKVPFFTFIYFFKFPFHKKEKKSVLNGK